MKCLIVVLDMSYLAYLAFTTSLHVQLWTVNLVTQGAYELKKLLLPSCVCVQAKYRHTSSDDTRKRTAEC